MEFRRSVQCPRGRWARRTSFGPPGGPVAAANVTADSESESAAGPGPSLLGPSHRDESSLSECPSPAPGPGTQGQPGWRHVTSVSYSHGGKPEPRPGPRPTGRWQVPGALALTPNHGHRDTVRHGQCRTASESLIRRPGPGLSARAAVPGPVGPGPGLPVARRSHVGARARSPAGHGESRRAGRGLRLKAPSTESASEPPSP